MAWYSVPMIGSIVDSLKLAHNNKGAPKSQRAIEFASDFDFEKIWKEKWIPLLQEHLK